MSAESGATGSSPTGSMKMTENLDGPQTEFESSKAITSSYKASVGKNWSENRGEVIKGNSFEALKKSDPTLSSARKHGDNSEAVAERQRQMQLERFAEFKQQKLGFAGKGLGKVSHPLTKHRNSDEVSKKPTERESGGEEQISKKKSAPGEGGTASTSARLKSSPGEGGAATASTKLS